jgi:hypothetical protein
MYMDQIYPTFHIQTRTLKKSEDEKPQIRRQIPIRTPPSVLGNIELVNFYTIEDVRPRLFLFFECE